MIVLQYLHDPLGVKFIDHTVRKALSAAKIEFLHILDRLPLYGIRERRHVLYKVDIHYADHPITVYIIGENVYAFDHSRIRVEQVHNAAQLFQPYLILILLIDRIVIVPVRIYVRDVYYRF